ncbi:hypothetical protein RGF97_14345 [Streptomyces roseicoloratus]|uniref:Secreted protein n=1 Tax=Streptomyces roseicoloratus TaxID=2508722 RepID=A0ABY9RUD8_9ACTN|nr:hypothetical protein [Streptomyces roseicoloratus]WMX45801.1 hypothetical protein RGF97_14345 [Streptomyces roseicoloratus]
MPTSPRTAQVQDVVSRLKAGLASHGITLPSLGVDPVTLAASGSGSTPPLVELGRCNLDTAQRLVVALTGDGGR